MEFHNSHKPIILKRSYQNWFTLKPLNVVFLLIRTFCYPECSTEHTESYVVLFLLCFLLFRISPPVCILWQLQDLILFEWNYLLCWLWNNTVWKFITWAPISAVTTLSQLTKQLGSEFVLVQLVTWVDLSLFIFMKALCSTSSILMHKFCDHCQDLVMKILILFCVQ